MSVESEQTSPKRAPKRTPARKAPAKSATPRRRATPKPEPVEPAPRPRSRRRLALIASLALVVAAAGAAAAAYVLVLRGDGATELRPGVATIVTAGELHSFAGSRAAYWAGDVPARRLELTATSTGVFVRYLPPGAEEGTRSRSLTIGTYALRNAYATATTRSTSTGMESARVGSGIAVWSRAEPTSVYLAWPGAPELVEVYAPDADEARRVALSGRVGPAA